MHNQNVNLNLKNRTKQHLFYPWYTKPGELGIYLATAKGPQGSGHSPKPARAQAAIGQCSQAHGGNFGGVLCRSWTQWSL